ncbi:hypothetical protein AB0I28_06615 [Phytomonospora sp. NPDC050363]|uniref:hypothetical protein n=1 Tax=Phytomonospora sp. NPDC050363 TaxID=3155642 RepID=UPI0033EC56FE
MDEVRDGIRAAQDSAQAAVAALEAARGEIEQARPVLMTALKGAMNPRAVSAEVELAQAVEACEEFAGLLRDGSGKFDEYLATVA